MKQSYKMALDLIKKYSRKSIFYEYVKKLTLLITLPFLIILSGVYYYHQRVINTEIRYSVVKNFDRAALLTNNMFDEFTNISLIYNENIYIELFLNTPTEELVQASNRYVDNIYDKINLSVNTSNLIDYISIYSFENDYVFSNKGGGYAASAAAHTIWYEHYKKTNESSFILLAQNAGNHSKTLYIATPLYSSKSARGMVIFEVSAETIDSMLLGSLANSAHTFCLIRSDGDVVYNTEGSESAHPDITELSQSITPDGKLHILRRNGKIYAYQPLSSTNNLNLFYMNDLSEMKGVLRNTRLLFAICILFSVLSPLAIALYISIKFYNSVANIMTLLNVSNSDDMSEVNEFTFISGHITELLYKNKSIESELIQRTSAFKQAQAQVLQSQLNPHFLFNTMHLIGLTSRVLLKGDNAVSKIVALLSDLLTAALDTHNYIVTIEEELNYTKKYFEIQKIRYKDGFDVIWDVDDSILQNHTIKLILQPLIENAFYHGISLLEDTRGVLRITAKTNEDGDIFFCVQDNGAPIPPEKLRDIRKKLETEDIPQKNHIGLANVNTRIKIIFGEKYGVQIFSDETGTSVYTTFPKE